VVAAPDPAGALGAFCDDDPVAVCIPDLTRPLDVRPALRELLPRLSGGAELIVGLGLHRPLEASELEAYAPFRPLQHDPDDCLPTAEVGGIPGLVGRPVAERGRAISVGVAELHQYAGLSGGHKGVAVGCGGRATLAALHARERVLAPGVAIGGLLGNPFRAAIDQLGEAAGCYASLTWVPGAGCWLFGEPRQVLAEALRRIQPWRPVQRRYRGAVLRVPAAKARSFYQASRAATYLGLSPSPPLEPGALLILEAACPEGLGAEQGFVDALHSEPAPWSRLLSGPAPEGAGAQRGVMLALLSSRYRLAVAGAARPQALQAAGLELWTGPLPQGPDWLEVPNPFGRLPQLEE
jgi:hypothetical protein